MFDLSDKVAVATGGSRGIWRAIAGDPRVVRPARHPGQQRRHALDVPGSGIQQVVPTLQTTAGPRSLGRRAQALDVVIGNPHNGGYPHSESGVDGFAFEGEYTEDAFMDAVEGFVVDEALEGFDAEGEFA
jgi:hypothetical protein